MLERCLARVDGVRYDLGMINNEGTDHRTAVARKVFKMKTDAPNAESLIEFADSHAKQYNQSEFGLDSLDLGDTLGYFISLLENDTSGNGTLFLVSPSGFTVTISEDWELFQWGIDLPPGPFDHLTPGDITG